MTKNNRVINSFGEEWKRFDQSKLDKLELKKIFNDYFKIFPWKLINKKSVGFDMGCGSGRWAKVVAPRVGLLNCIEPSLAIEVAKKNLNKNKNVKFIKLAIEDINLKPGSQDFGYCLGVLHHTENTQKNLKKCISLLKKNAPFLVYLYYKFDNRNLVYHLIWKISDILRKIISKLPEILKIFFSDLLAIIIYYPLAKTSFILDKINFDTKSFPLSYYKNLSFYTMRTDSRDRFGTNLEKRYTKKEIENMLKNAGLYKIKFSNNAPYWCATGFKK
jgi:SAM-dependent methyltransferase